MAGTWTKNWRAFRNIMLMGSHHNGLSTIRNTEGVTVADRSSDNLSATSPLGTYSNDQSSSNASSSIRLGTGSTAPTAADYALEQAASVNYLSCAVGAPVYDDSVGTVTRTITVSVQNTGSENVTIREWGIFGTVRTMASYSSNVATALLYREVLDSPVTLGQYQAASLELTVSLTLTDPVS